MLEHDLTQRLEVAVEQRGDGLGLHRVAHPGEALEIAEQHEDLLALAVQPQQLGVLDDLLGHLARQVLAERALREAALDGARGARGGHDRGQRGEPAQDPSRRGQAVRVDPPAWSANGVPSSAASSTATSR